MNQQAKSTSPWIYIGCGCFLLVFLAAISVVGAGIFGFKRIESYVEEMKDPVARQEKALDLLGARELPEGYHTHVVFGIPWILDVTVLGTAEPSADPGEQLDDLEKLGDRVFIYVEMREFGDQKEELDRYLDGEEGASDIFDQLDINVDFEPKGDALARGRFELDGRQVRYVSQQGEYRSGGERGEGIYSISSTDCPDKDRLRLGVWLHRLPEEEAGGAIEQAVSPGGPGDEAALRDFLGHFNPCAS